MRGLGIGLLIALSALYGCRTGQEASRADAQRLRTALVEDGASYYRALLMERDAVEFARKYLRKPDMTNTEAAANRFSETGAAWRRACSDFAGVPLATESARKDLRQFLNHCRQREYTARGLGALLIETKRRDLPLVMAGQTPRVFPELLAAFRIQPPLEDRLAPLLRKTIIAAEPRW